MEPFSEEKDFSNEFVVWDWHGNWSEELFKIIREFGSTSVTFSCRVESDKNARVEVDLHSLSKQVDNCLPCFDGLLNNLNLLADRR